MVKETQKQDVGQASFLGAKMLVEPFSEKEDEEQRGARVRMRELCIGPVELAGPGGNIQETMLTFFLCHPCPATRGGKCRMSELRGLVVCQRTSNSAREEKEHGEMEQLA